jgi:predicted metal-dependent enzyme (double-stranded beta helix superfamily)
MCDLGHPHGHHAFGYLVDAPEIRALIDETRRLTHAIADTAARVEAMKPAFARLLAAEGWLPEPYGAPDHSSGMGSGIGQYALYRAEDGSLTLFSLVIPAGAETPVHDHLAWGLIGVYRGRQDETVYQRLDDGRDESRADLVVSRAQPRPRPATSTRCCRRVTTSIS